MALRDHSKAPKLHRVLHGYETPLGKAGYCQLVSCYVKKEQQRNKWCSLEEEEAEKKMEGIFLYPSNVLLKVEFVCASALHDCIFHNAG